MKITKRVVDGADPDPNTRYLIWDSKLTGFGLLVLPSGVRSYVFDYRNAEGRKRRLTIGKHGAWTAEEARNKAVSLAAVVKAGDDPLDQKQALRESLTLGGLFDRYLMSERHRGKAPSTISIEKGRIKRHLRPLLGREHLHRLTPDKVRSAMVAIRDGKTAIVEKTGPRGVAKVTGGRTTARDTIALLRFIVNWAIEEGLETDNPCASVRLDPPGYRTRFVEDQTQYRRMFEALDTLESVRGIRKPAADAIRVIAITGARKSEIATARWRHVDLAGGVIRLPPDAHKSGRTTGKDRLIFLPEVAQRIIAERPQGGPEDYVFAPARSSVGPIDLRKPWRRVRAEAGLPSDMGLHALRHSIASHMALNGAQAAEIMAALGHRQLSTVQRYIHFAEQARAQLAEKAAASPLAGMRAAGKVDGEETR